MTTRRGTTLLASDFAKQMRLFSPGDIVASTVVGCADFTGTVVSTDIRLNKVFVNWGDGLSVQHDPDEIQLMVQAEEWASERVKTLVARRTRGASGSTVEQADADPQYVGDPEMHGLDHPRGGGFSIMQNLQKDLRKEILEESEEGPKISPIQATDGLRSRRALTVPQKHQKAIALKTLKMNDVGVKVMGGMTKEEARDFLKSIGYSDSKIRQLEASEAPLRSRRAMYWNEPERVYRLTRQEQAEGCATCPKCKKEMAKERFTRSDKLLSCPKCGFKIPTSKTTTERRKVEIEVEPNGEVEVEVTASCRRGRMAEDGIDLSNLSRMKIYDIAALIAQDWGRKVNYAAKPYLEAMFSLDSVDDNYIMDSGKSIVAYFLSNATSWRGDVARAVKNELKKRIR